MTAKIKSDETPAYIRISPHDSRYMRAEWKDQRFENIDEAIEFSRKYCKQCSIADSCATRVTFIDYLNQGYHCCPPLFARLDLNKNFYGEPNIPSSTVICKAFSAGRKKVKK